MIKGLLLDYGGTIDTNGQHWGAVLWDSYQRHQVAVDKEAFAKAYAFGERALAINPLVRPDHSFYDVLCLKIEQQFDFLQKQGFTLDNDAIQTIAMDCHLFAQSTIDKAKPVLAALAGRYPMVVVSNFYGNLNTVLVDGGIRSFFSAVVESAVVGIRKPDPQLYQLGADALQLSAHACAAIGDSYTKDMQPAKAIGCQTIWLTGKGWEETVSRTDVASTVDREITDFAQLAWALETIDQPFIAS